MAICIVKRDRRGVKRQMRKRGKRLRLAFILLAMAMILIFIKDRGKYTVALDPGHGGSDMGAIGVITEVELTERTTAYLEEMLKSDGRFRVVLSRKYGEGEDINQRNKRLRKSRPDIVLSIHANADPRGTGTGFECYPSPPGRKNYGESYRFAQVLGEEMAAAGSCLRGNQGIRYGYYIPDETGEFIKTIKESNDTTVYGYGSFGMVEGMKCPAVLVEQCFVTNAGDVAAFGTDEGCKKAAMAYYRAILQCLHMK